jgi:TAG lipase/steryl ester hydrolase/phospholipase A2/LPA acyltransferase
LQDRLRHLLGEYTFEEAYARSGIALNVAVSAADTSEPVRLLNYLTAPNVLIWSAVACSSAFPFLFAPQTLLARDSRGHIAPFANKSAGESQRRWRDGSLESDLPMRGLSEMFNVNYFLVSQCNPYLLPVIAAKEALPRPIGSLLEMEFKHRCQQLMEIMPKRTLRLLKLLSQPWSGDTTVRRRASLTITSLTITDRPSLTALGSLARSPGLPAGDDPICASLKSTDVRSPRSLSLSHPLTVSPAHPLTHPLTPSKKQQ